VRDGVASFEEKPPSADEMAARIRRHQSTHAWLVCERDGEVVGYAYATPHRERAAYRWSIEVSVYVAAAHARQGIGRRLYQELLEQMRGRGFRMALAGFTLPNDASVALHEGLGFRPVGVFHDIGWKHDAWHDVGWWELDLTDGSGGPPAERPSPPT
jgi:phosphinothricin acetyltransferase